MTDRRLALAKCASDLVGAPFRRGGQALPEGFDCIGLVRHCLLAIDCQVTSLPPYRTRNSDIRAFRELAHASGLFEANGSAETGDILVCKPGCAQYHLAIAVSRERSVHAHASLRKVTSSPLPLPWPLHAIWRLNPSGDR